MHSGTGTSSSCSRAGASCAGHGSVKAGARTATAPRIDFIVIVTFMQISSRSTRNGPPDCRATEAHTERRSSEQTRLHLHYRSRRKSSWAFIILTHRSSDPMTHCRLIVVRIELKVVRIARGRSARQAYRSSGHLRHDKIGKRGQVHGSWTRTAALCLHACIAVQVGGMPRKPASPNSLAKCGVINRSAALELKNAVQPAIGAAAELVPTLTTSPHWARSIGNAAQTTRCGPETLAPRPGRCSQLAVPNMHEQTCKPGAVDQGIRSVDVLEVA